MVVLPQVVVVKLDERVDRLLHGTHLDQSHLMILSAGGTSRTLKYQGLNRTNTSCSCFLKKSNCDLLEELESLDRGS